jgi:hypothetical protein
LLVKIGEVTLTNSQQAQYTVQTYLGGSIGIRGLVQSESDTKSTEEQLYRLREGSVSNVQVEADDGKVFTGLYKIRELSWKKERGEGGYELRFNIGLQKQ